MADHPSRERRWRPRSWRHSGAHKRLPTVGELAVADAVRAQLVADHCGDGDPSAGQQLVLSMIVSAAARHASVAPYLASLGDVPYVDKRARRAWRLVAEDLPRMERHLALLLQALTDPALRRAEAPVRDLDEYLAEHDAAAPADADADSSDPPAASTSGECQE